MAPAEALQALTSDRHADFQAALFGAGGALTVALLAELFVRVQGQSYALSQSGHKSKSRAATKAENCESYQA
jgi:hypothetical protein